MTTPLYNEDAISQIPAIKLLIQLGWEYLSPEQALRKRGGKSSNVLLEEVLKAQLRKINTIHYKSQEFDFSDNNIHNAVLALKNLPMEMGLMAANKAFYELITLGKSFEQNVLGDQKSFTLNFIDWKDIANNSFHISEEYSVLRSERSDDYRPDIVLFINGIPMVVMECKSPSLKYPVELAIEQHLRNQQDDGIRSLYKYTNLLFALTSNEAKYATTATIKKFWSVWKEAFSSKESKQEFIDELQHLKKQDLPEEIWRSVIQNSENRRGKEYSLEVFRSETITEQDKLLFSIAQPKRLLELIHDFIVYDDGVKKVARYQQYFSIKKLLARIGQVDAFGRHPGGVIWHTQGSGKSLTMVMLAQMIAEHPAVKNPKIILVTDRIDLDSQITETFQKCKLPVENAQTGKHLVELLKSNTDSVITTLVHKFEAAVNQQDEAFTSTEIFVLVDEGHRSQYGSFNVKMQKVFPNACFIAFTGTPLMKKEKSTASKFGGIIDVYSIKDAVEDGAVVPLLYEGRHNLVMVNEKPLDNYFEKVAEPLTPYGKAALKRKFSSKDMLNQADQVVYARAWDITEHFESSFKGTPFKGQLVTPNKATAIKYKNYLDEIGKVSSEVIISAPDMREGEEDAFEVSTDAVKAFWKARMDKYGNVEQYEKTIINAFKKSDHPEIIIVVDKLLTGFDAPRNIVLYITRSLKEHTLLQAIARVNRLYEGKEYGFIIDYFGNLENLNTALNVYSEQTNAFDAEDLEGIWTDLEEEIKKLPQIFSELWDIFKTVRNKYDIAAYEEVLRDEEIRHHFYEKLSEFARILKVAFSSYNFEIETDTSKKERYRKDLKFFLQLRISVKRRYSDDVDFKEYEPQVQKLIDTHLTTEGEMLKVTDLVNIFNKEEREAEIEKLTGKAAKADHIASRTIRAINVKMDDDPIYYKRLSRLIRDLIDDYLQQRIEEAEYLQKARLLEEEFLEGQQVNVPENLKGNEVGIAFYHWVEELFPLFKEMDLAAQVAEEVDSIIKREVFDGDKPKIDWPRNSNLVGQIKNTIDDYIYDLKTQRDIEISFTDIDTFMEEVLKIAIKRYQ